MVKELVLLITIIASTGLALLMIISNIELNRKIQYYESPQGVLERSRNESAEREYGKLLNVSRENYVLGLASLTISIGGVGMYVNVLKNKRVCGETSEV